MITQHHVHENHRVSVTNFLQTASFHRSLNSGWVMPVSFVEISFFFCDLLDQKRRMTNVSLSMMRQGFSKLLVSFSDKNLTYKDVISKNHHRDISFQMQIQKELHWNRNIGFRATSSQTNIIDRATRWCLKLIKTLILVGVSYYLKMCDRQHYIREPAGVVAVVEIPKHDVHLEGQVRF